MLIMYIGLLGLENPSKPEIVYAEFPVALTYEINGESRTIKDTLICEYDGIGMDEGSGKYRKWKGTLASGKENIIIWTGRSKEGKELMIYYNLEPAGYFMGDEEYKDGNESNFSNIVLVEKNKSCSTYEAFISEKRLYKISGIKIIDYVSAEPIKNSFD